MKIAIFQPPYPEEGTKESAEKCLGWMQVRLDNLKAGEQDLVLLPEYAGTPGLNDKRELRDFAESQGMAFLKAVAMTAKRLQCIIAFATPVQSGAQWFNRTLVFDAAGNEVFTYDKIHLPDAERYELGLAPGANPAIFESGSTRIGFATCFDLYFQEYFAVLAAQGVDLVLCPSYQRSESAERIRSIAQMRALDSGSYLLRSSYSMKNPEVGGRSLVAAPDGMLLADAGADAGILRVELDPAKKFVKPASHGQAPVEHRALIESRRRPGTYRPSQRRAEKIMTSTFPRLCAHRGMSQACPENTTLAFAAAMAAGAHEVEFDVRTSKDGILLVCHDPSVDRTTDGSGKIEEMNWDEIRLLDAGKTAGDAWNGVCIPRLEEVLNVVDGRVGMNIHIQSGESDKSAVKRVCDLLRERGLTATAYLALGSEAELRRAFEYAPEIHRACLTRQEEPSVSLEIAEQYACKRIQFFRGVKNEHTKQAHDLGMICNLFWSDDPKDALKYVEKGIDVVLTNCPHTLIAGGFTPFSAS